MEGQDLRPSAAATVGVPREAGADLWEEDVESASEEGGASGRKRPLGERGKKARKPALQLEDIRGAFSVLVVRCAH